MEITRGALIYVFSAERNLAGVFRVDEVNGDDVAASPGGYVVNCDRQIHLTPAEILNVLKQ